MTTSESDTEQQKERFVIAWCSDTHSNHSLGLMPPEVLLESGSKFGANRAQREWTWPAFLEFCRMFDSLAASRPGTTTHRIVVLGGDNGDIDLKNRTSALVSRNPTDVSNIMTAAHAPLLRLADRVYVLRGTEAHVGLESAIEEMWARRIGADPLVLGDPIKVQMMDGSIDWDNQKYARDDMVVTWGGVKLDMAHHMRGASRAWTAGSPAVTVAAETIIECVNAGEVVPHLVLRGHVHRNLDSGDWSPRCRVVSSLGWQIGDADGVSVAHLKRIDPVKRVRPVGGLVIVIEDGAYTVHKFTSSPPKMRDEGWA